MRYFHHDCWEEFQPAIGIVVKALSPLVFQAQQKVSQGKTDEALEKLDKALQLDEYSANAWMLKGSS
jgi:Flp pilus assembly protein TadD